MRSYFYLILFTLFIYTSCYSSGNNPSEKKSAQLLCVTQATQALSNWNDYLRNDLSALHQDGWAIYSIGLDQKNAFAIHVGKRSLGSYFIRSGKIENGIQLLKDAARYFKRAGNYEVLTETLNEIGNGYVYQSESGKAIPFFLQSLKVGEKSDDPTSSFLAEINLAQAYMQLKEYDKANALLLDYKNKALQYNKFEAVSSAYALLGSLAQLQEKAPLAKEFYLKSASFGFRSKANGLIGQAYTNYAIALFLESNFNLAKIYFERALKFRLKTKNSRSIAESYYNLGDFYTQLEQFSKAIYFFEKSYKISEENELFQDQIDALNSINELYKQTNNTKKQLETVQLLVKCQEQKLNKKMSLTLQDAEMEQLLIKDKFQQQMQISTNRLHSQISEKNDLIMLFFMIFGCFFFGAIIFIANQSIQASRKN